MQYNKANMLVDHKPQLVDHKPQPSKTRFVLFFQEKISADHKPQCALEGEAALGPQGITSTRRGDVTDLEKGMPWPSVQDELGRYRWFRS